MSTATLPTVIPKPITRKVAALRWLVRGYVLLEGTAAVVIAAGLAFWIALWLDWSLEPSPQVRVGLWCLTGMVLGWVGWRQLIRRIMARLTDTNLALLVERCFPQFEQSLITTVQVGATAAGRALTEQTLLKRTFAQAGEGFAAVHLGQLFRYRPLVGKLCCAGLLFLSVITFALVRGESFRFWLDRMALSTAAWPRTVQLTAVGFEDTGGKRVVNVPRDGSFELQVFASLMDKHQSPEEVEIRYRLADGRRGRDVMTKVGESRSGQDASQAFRYEFKNLAADVEFDIVGGDDRIRELRLHVVERPQIVRTGLDCVFPEYLDRPPQTVPFSGRAEVPTGTRVLCRVEVNKPLQAARAYEPSSQNELVCELAGDAVGQFTLEMGEIAADRVVLVELADTDGVSSREPYRLLISAVPDELPEVAARLRGIGSAVTAQAAIPLVGAIRDDHGATAAWIELRSKRGAQQRRELSNPSSLTRENSELGLVDLAETDATDRRRLVLEPGDQLSLVVQAQDACNLSPEPHVGASQLFLLDVVTESELRALLEKRELGLRQRFEALQEKMLAVRDLLSRLTLPADEQNSSATRAAAQERDQLRISGAEQSVTQTIFEVDGIAEGFEDIVIELINNRIDTEELRQRLGGGIAEPLRELAGVQLPAVEERVRQLSADWEQKSQAASGKTATIIALDAVIEAMQRILDRMLELESYNELVELLRGIVDDQKQLNEETRARRREQLRSLLEE